MIYLLFLTFNTIYSGQSQNTTQYVVFKKRKKLLKNKSKNLLKTTKELIKGREYRFFLVIKSKK
jgi:hypothetical protein